MASYPYALFDAFSSHAFGGSPAAIVADAQDLGPAQMQKIAKEFAAPATGFVTGFDGTVIDVRFFSTLTEYPMCGHGTIALVTWLVECEKIQLIAGESSALMLRTPFSSALMQTKCRDDGRPEIMLELSPATFEHYPEQLDLIAPLLGITPAHISTASPIAITNSDFTHLIVPICDLSGARALAPNFSALKEYCLSRKIDTVMAYTMETEQPEHAIHCREFCPAVGTNEAAASGTTNRALACYLVENNLIDYAEEGICELISEQGIEMGRESQIHIELMTIGHKVVKTRVGGVATRVMEGELTLF